MKAFFSYVAVLSLLISISISSSAQEMMYKTRSGMTIGFGIGGSYQTSDIKNSTGGGFDFHLGSYLYKRDGAPISLDWKFRFLAGENRAYDHRINSDYTYSNIRFRHFNYDLEIGLTLNRLMERTRIVLTGFAGAGISHGITYTDLYDSSGNPYDYSLINPDNPRSQVKADLLAISDNDFETALVNRAAVLPTAGIYLGYQFSRSFSVGIIHKVNFSLTEHNGAFGINMDNNILNGSFIDMNHYTSLGFKWILGGGKQVSSARRNTQYISPVQNTRMERADRRPTGIISEPHNLPEVNITIPYYDIYRTSDRDIDITARVRWIDSEEDISVKYDNVYTDFEFDPQSRRVNIPVFIDRDTSLLIITGSNVSGSASDSLLLIFEEPVKITGEGRRTQPVTVTNPVRVNENIRTNNVISRNEIRRENEAGRISRERRDEQINVTEPVRVNPPVVRFINPESPVKVENNMFSLKVQTYNVASWDDVDVVINKVKNSNFSFTRDGVVNLNIGLIEGVNTIEVSGENSAGRVTEETSISYMKPSIMPVAEVPCLAPSVKFSVSTIKSYDATHKLTGNITNVKQESGIKLTINGAIQDFQYNPSGGQITAYFNLSPGSYTIVLNARNDCGEDSGSYRVSVSTQEVEEEEEQIQEQEEHEEAAGGIRINPGNSSWQFCLETPRGRYNRDNLTNSNFNYSGPATSLYIMPAAGGGTARVNGKPFKVRSGQYYLFTGNLTVTVSTRNPGSMGHWSVIIKADSAPASGSGNRRPKSPCESGG
ncbi:MAG: hypothetical protein RQ743_06420 [Bacteroidales bacterium]|nr:hypothetical protein [Bacteroidales bacterium]